MGFELQKALKMETRRLLWLIGLILATVILFQCVELPKDSFVFSWTENHGQRTNTFSGDNTTSPSIVIVLDNPKFTLPKNMSSVFDPDKNDIALPPVQSEDFTSYVAVPPASPPIAAVFPSAINYSYVGTQTENIALPPGQNGEFTPYVVLPPASPPKTVVVSPPKTEGIALPPGQIGNFIPNLSIAPPPFVRVPVEKSKPKPKPEVPPKDVPTSSDMNFIPNLSIAPPPFVRMPVEKPKPEAPPKDVLTLSDMNEILIQNQLSPQSMVPRWPMKVDDQLVFARSEIENAPPSSKDVLYAPLYHNASMFQRSYELMEQMLKVYIYKEGERPIFHNPPLEGIYASEGWFMKLLEANRQFVTKHSQEALLFYLPFSSLNLEKTLYVPNSHRSRNLVLHLKGYVDRLTSIYPFWNRTNGADHFLVACHDWAPHETKRYMANCIRALCNADVKEGFTFGKDVSLPETYVRKASNPTRGVGGRPPSKRKTLAFFAGNMHGYLRPILLQHWGNDKNMQIFATLPRSKGNKNYIDYMKGSKYCICPRGYEVNSPRVVEAIFYECVPVIISDNFVPPFLETLNWETFSVFVAEKDIPNLKEILLSIPEKTYKRMFMRVRKVQQHFLWHPKPVKYDLFHMILHSIWYNRVFQFRPRL